MNDEKNIIDNNRLSLTPLKWIQFAFFSCILLYLGKPLFVPLLFGLLIALIMYPVCKKIESIGWPRSVAVSIVLLFVLILFSTLIWLLFAEINIFLKDFPLISNRLTKLSPNMQQWFASSFGMSISDENMWLRHFSQNVDAEVAAFLKSFFAATVSTAIMIVMVPIYTALSLYHRETFVRYLEELFGASRREVLHRVLSQSVVSYSRFIKGNFYVYCIVGVLNSIGLLALGIRHAVLYGMLTSFMMVIPYVGIFISASIPISIALVTKDSLWYPVAVILIFVFIQYLESNVIFPRVVGEQLNLSTWSTLVGIVAGTILWGLAGMALVTPFLAITKIVTDFVPEWRALNILLNRNEGYQHKKRGKTIITQGHIDRWHDIAQHNS